KPAIGNDHAEPGRGKLSVKRIRRLEPGACVKQIKVERVCGVELIIHAVEDVLFVAFVVHYGELRTIEKSAAVQSVDGNEIAPVLAAIGKIEAGIGSAERAVGGDDAAVRSGDTLAGARGGLDDQAGLVSEFGGRGSGDNFQRLDRVNRQLIREHLALLVGDGLAVHRKRIFGVVAEPVEQTVGIRSDSRRGERYQGTDGRRRTFQGKLVEQGAVHVGVEGGFVLHQVATAFDSNGAGAAGHGSRNLQREWNRRANVNVLGVSAKSRVVDGQVIGIERHVDETEIAGRVGGGGA